MGRAAHGAQESAGETSRPLVVSASRRTDLPALWPDWFMERVRSGFVDVANPFRPAQVRRVELRPEKVVAVVAWTRDPRPLAPHIDEICERVAPLLWQVTINGMPRFLEPRSPEANRVVEAVHRLAARSGAPAVRWRYDPIVLTSATPRSWHVDNFARLARALAGAVEVCHTSFVDLHYRAARRRLAAMEEATGVRLLEPDLAERRALARELSQVAREHGIELVSCCESDLAAASDDGEEEAGSRAPVRPAGCITAAWVARACGREADATRRPTRPGCLCTASVDIGAYGTCRHGCLYCYATRS